MFGIKRFKSGFSYFEIKPSQNGILLNILREQKPVSSADLDNAALAEKSENVEFSKSGENRIRIQLDERKKTIATKSFSKKIHKKDILKIFTSNNHLLEYSKWNPDIVSKKSFVVKFIEVEIQNMFELASVIRNIFLREYLSVSNNTINGAILL